MLRGSGRSVGEFDLIGCIGRCSELLEQYGGHPAAAGLILQKEKYAKFHVMLQQEAARMCEYMPPSGALDRQIGIDAGNDDPGAEIFAVTGAFWHVE